LGELVGHEAEILGLSSDQAGAHLLSGARDRLAILWSGLDKEVPDQWVLEHQRAVTGVSLSADGTVFATADADNTMRLWDVASKVQYLEWQVAGLGKLQGLAVSSDGALVATGLKLSARVYSSSRPVGSRSPSLQGGALGGASVGLNDDEPFVVFGPHDAEVRSLVFSSDGRRLVTGDVNGKIYVWDVSGAESLIELEGHAEEIVSLSFSEEGRTLLSADVSGEVLAWRSEFDGARYRRWRKLDRVPLRAKRIVEYLGGDIHEAATLLKAGHPVLKISDPAVEFILEEALGGPGEGELKSSVDES
jgi:WD40 repeat protein